MSSKAEQFFNEASAYVTRCRAMVAEGKETDLAGLDALAAQLCDMAVALNAEERQKHALQLEQLVTELGTLSLQLAARHSEIGEEIHGLGKVRRASIAYRTAEVSDKKD